MCDFNKWLSSIQIISEYAYGWIKGHFPSLKAAGKHQDMKELYKAIEVLLVLHNICLDCRDRPEDIPDFDLQELHDNDNDEADVDPDEDLIIPADNTNIPQHETTEWIK